MKAILDTRVNLSRRAVTTAQKLIILQVSNADGSIPVNKRFYFKRDFQLNNAVIKSISSESALQSSGTPIYPGSLVYELTNNGFNIFGPLATYFTLTLRDSYDNILWEDYPYTCLSNFANSLIPTGTSPGVYAARRCHLDATDLYGRVCMEKSYLKYVANSGIPVSNNLYYALLNFTYTPIARNKTYQ